jgi:hypothetical protein
MTVMVAEHVEPDMLAIPASDRAFLREEKKPPKHWRIWIGAHNNHSFPLYSHMVSEFVEKKAEGCFEGLSETPNTQTTTICIGDHLVIYIMSSIIGYNLFRRWVLPVQIRSGMYQLWPHSIRTGDVRWRTDRRLTDAGLALLATHFSTKPPKSRRGTSGALPLIAHPPRAGLSARHYILLSLRQRDNSRNIGEGSEPHVTPLAINLKSEHPRLGAGRRGTEIKASAVAQYRRPLNLHHLNRREFARARHRPVCHRIKNGGGLISLPRRFPHCH